MTPRLVRKADGRFTLHHAYLQFNGATVDEAVSAARQHLDMLMACYLRSVGDTHAHAMALERAVADGLKTEEADDDHEA